MICLLNKIKKIICIDIMVWVCVISLFLQTVVVYALNSSDDSISKETIVENNTSSQSDDSIDISDIYENNVIKIYNTKQLQAIGSNSIVTSTDNDESNYGTGQQISVNDEYITYSLSSKYQLMKDISLNGNDIWTLPSDFTGTFNHGTVDENSTLYDSSTDTIYIYNDYQLKIIQSDNSENEPVMSQDMLPECVGMGQPVYSDNSSNYLTYSKSHNYVLSKNFTGEMPETKANQISNISTENCEGRDFNGQVVKTIGDKTYILIGNEEQLRKIGSDETVYGAVYQVYLHAAKWYIDEDENGNPIMLYGGDADLEKSQNDNEDFGFGEKNIHKEDKKLSKYSSHLYAWGRCGVNQSTGEIDPTLDIDKATNQKYSSNANYIIFRNIDLSSDNWTPLMFQGTMIGSKGDGKSTLWNNDTSVIDYSKATDLNIGEKPVISNVNVSQTSELDVGKQMGVGFFATLSNEASDSDLGLSKGTVTVKNLKFNKINVDNETTKTKFDQTLISGLTSTLGKALGGLLDGLTWLLTFGTVNAGLRDTLNSILNARKDDPTALATGCFAGRVVGDVAISDCELDDVKVTNVNSNTGGFIGYISGKTEYDGLSKGLGGTATLLAKILNVIPGLGLGDLITILLGNAIPVDKLIPTKYINAYVENCSINNLTGNIGTNNDKIENSGGFIGQQKGTVVKDCQITNSNFNVKANNYSGGFVGLARDDVIEGTLSGALDIETQLPKMNPENLFLNCSVSASDLTISGNGYQGGFSGAMANTSAINCNVNVSDKLTVSSGGDNSGGFAGIATIGWVADLGKGDTKDNLLGGVVDLVVKLLSSNQNATSSLLSLAGVSPSHILGCQINAPCSVEGKNYTGGLIGRGDGVYLTKSNTDNLSKVSYFKNNIFSMDGIEEKNIIINGLKSVDGENCVGGISGSVGTASVAGLLNTTLGVAEYLGFNANSISLTGSTEGITIGGKGKRVGGAFGEAIGGSISSVTVTNLNNISGENIVGGFIGVSGPGDLAGTDNGLTVNLLGLNYILKLSNLLSLGQAVEVNIDSSSVSGINSGFTVEATGSREDNSTTDYVAAGFVAKSNSTKINDAKVNNLKTVTSTDDGGYSGGFIGISKTGGLAEVGDETEIKKLISANGLLNAVGYLIPSYQQCYVSYVDNGGVRGDIAGGFVGDFQSGIVENDENNAYAIQNISYVKGKTYAGGFGGKVYSGALADSTKGISILGGLADLNIQISDLLSLIQVYIPIIKNAGVQSNGLVVSCDTYKSTDLNSGSAGGYIGYGSAVRVSNSSVTKLKHTTVKTPNANINDTDSSSYFGESSSYAISAPKNAGGFSGRTDCANTVDTGNISVLYGLINLDNPLSALSAVYPTETNTATYGPLRGLTTEVWNSWVKAVGVNGAYGKKFQELGEVDNQDELDKIIDQYAYGYEVKAGRTNAGSNDYQGGIAGGYVGQMNGGEVTFANARDLKDVTALKSSGGFAGEMISAGVANVGDINLGNKLNVVGSLPILQSFIPVVKTSSVTGFQSGATISTTGTDFDNDEGNSGGFVGKVVGGKIEGTQDQYCLADQLKVINGSQNVGGFAGNIQPGSAVTLNTSSNTGLLSKLLKYLLGNAGDLAKVLNATLSIVDYAKVDAWNDYGLSVNGSYTLENDETTKYAKQVGGFVGNAGGAIFGDKDATSVRVEVNNIRNVVGGRDVGGFFGLADVSSVAQVGNDDSDQILNLIKLGNIDVLDAFRTYVYQAKVTGSNDNGLSVCANDESQEGTLDSKVQTGNAGGFGGSLLDGSIKNSSVTGLNKVKAKNYAGGFVGHMGKSGVVDLDEAGVGTGKLLNATAGVLDIFGSHSDNCSVIGIPVGFTISSESGKEPISGGFVGYADLGRMSNCNVENIKKVASDQIAGGFVGKTSFEYLANIDLGSSYLLDPILSIVNKLLDILYVGDLENVGLIDINLGSLLKLQVLAKGNALSVTLLGLTISVVLDKDRGDGTSDLAKITIGDSYIEIPCSNIDGNHIADSEKENIKVGLIKSNRTKVDGCSITGIHDGYDVFGGKANDSHDGSEENGQAGGFIGYNNEGLIENNEMYLADTIRGTSNQIGPFSGTTSLNSSYDFNTKKNIEGKDNTYRIYRTRSDSLIDIIKNSSLYSKKDSDFDNWNIFKIRHYDKVQKYDDLKDAKLSDESKSETVDLNAYVSPAKAVLMDDTEVSDNEDGTTPIPSDTQDPCNEKINITINKLWKDLSDKQKERPDTITVTLTRTYMKGSEEILEKVGDYTLSANDVTDSKNTWQTIIKGLDAYTTLDDGSKAYYTYSVTESEVENYITSIEESDDGYTFTITNKDMPLLPNLGGKGTMLFVLVGIVGVLAVLLSYKKSKKAKNIKE